MSLNTNASAPLNSKEGSKHSRYEFSEGRERILLAELEALDHHPHIVSQLVGQWPVPSDAMYGGLHIVHDPKRLSCSSTTDTGISIPACNLMVAGRNINS